MIWFMIATTSSMSTTPSPFTSAAQMALSSKKNADLVQDSKLDYADLEQMLNAIKAGRSLQQ
ncbi:hypothetical protein [Ruminococcus sp.]|uniref:hypothetical protein n=1 Tax=Ruminococcus sp. TaxID=41978 RepID=UPI0025D6910E|nr:hypothetical protein [Ruminococcus sp.]